MVIKYNLDINFKKEDDESLYSYRLIEGEYNNEVAFGIEVERKDIINGKLNRVERESVEVISKSEDKVREILEILSKNKVSPIHFIEIAGEYIDKCAEEFSKVDNLELVYS